MEARRPSAAFSLSARACDEAGPAAVTGKAARGVITCAASRRGEMTRSRELTPNVFNYARAVVSAGSLVRARRVAVRRARLKGVRPQLIGRLTKGLCERTRARTPPMRAHGVAGAAAQDESEQARAMLESRVLARVGLAHSCTKVVKRAPRH